MHSWYTSMSAKDNIFIHPYYPDVTSYLECSCCRYEAGSSAGRVLSGSMYWLKASVGKLTSLSPVAATSDFTPDKQ